MTMRLTNDCGMSAELNANGSLRRLDCGAVSLMLFPGSELEGGPANLYLRRLRPPSGPFEWTALLGPRSPGVLARDPHTGAAVVSGRWQDIDYRLTLRLAQGACAWFWHLWLHNGAARAQQVDLTYVQDLALAPYGAVRMNEYYVSQYVDHTPLQHGARGCLVASRQNQPVDARHPWSLIGSLRNGAAYGTDALQFYGLSGRAGDAPPGLAADLPGRRLQHEHSMVVIRDAPLRLEPGRGAAAGFFGLFLADHPPASSAADLTQVDEALGLAEAAPAEAAAGPAAEAAAASAATLFSSSAPLAARDLDGAQLHELFAGPWRHEELDERGERLSFFHGSDAHVVLRAKELRVLRPHGRLLRSGRHLTPAETALTSTAWMAGVFHSMVAQGHVSINRVLSSVRGYLGLFHAHGQRVFVELDGRWQLLDVPSAFEMSTETCRWLYRHEHGLLEVRAGTRCDPDQGQGQHALTLSITVLAGAPVRWLITHHFALNGDDGAAPGAVQWRRVDEAIVVTPAAGSDLARRFPDGEVHLQPGADTVLERVGGDELLFADGRSRHQPYLCLLLAASTTAVLSIRPRLIGAETQSPQMLEPGAALAPALVLAAPAASPLAPQAARLAEIAPWLTHDAQVHFLSPRGLEQFSGGGWGTRDVCQGPVEMLLALDRTAPIRDILLRVMGAQNPDGDWPQWFMFFERDRHIRAGDSHGDIVLWPLVVLAQYLVASGDAAVLDEPVAFFDARGAQAGERASVWEHAQRALALLARRVFPGTTLAAYGHGDWNDSLQPVDPRLREHLCSAWTVTLQIQALTSLAQALRAVGRAAEAEAAGLEARAQAVRQDFQRLLLADGVLAGYALYQPDGGVRYLLHPRDQDTGVHYSALAMIHAILEDVFTPAQAREHLQLIETHLSGPDGVRLFDQPMPYHGGPQRLFQRAESATFFGREIGLMYMHAHLRYAQALAHVGDARRFFHALCQANPIGIRTLVPSATLRQANCYYSSSDAAFEDRYQAREQYARVARGTVALDGGWRVYSSGAGIALGLIRRRFLGLSAEAQALRVDPVMPAELDGLQAGLTLAGQPLQLHYRVGSAGCGVNAVRLNGTPLPFTSAANPHRRGAALVQMAQVQRQLRTGGSTLEVEIG
jgi:cellobiose phosphorylase